MLRSRWLIGITGVRYLAGKVAQLSGRPMRLFKTEEEAFDWLTGKAPSDGEEIAVRGAR